MLHAEACGGLDGLSGWSGLAEMPGLVGLDCLGVAVMYLFAYVTEYASMV